MFKHYFSFDKRLTNRMQAVDGRKIIDWNILRNDNVEGNFSIENTVVSYENNCHKAYDYQDLAEIIYSVITKYNLENKSIISLGSGKGILEYMLKFTHSELKVFATDYTKEAIDKLSKVNKKIDKAFVFDVLNGNYNELNENSLLLMFRISTEFDKKTWERIFNKIYKSNIEYIIYVPTENVRFIDILNELFHYIRNIILNKDNIFCGYLYAHKEFIEMFTEQVHKFKILEDITYKNTSVFLLKKDNCLPMGCNS